VAGAAVGSHRLWRFAVPIAVVVRRQPPPDQSRLADRGRAGRPTDCAGSFSSTTVDYDAVTRFRGFEAAWHIPADAPTAQSGRWTPGPGAGFFGSVDKVLGGLPFIAEDLGTITPDVSALRDDFRIPGTRVLQFAFDGHADNPYLPSNYVANTVVYTGTHDNPTTRGWYEDLPDGEHGNLWRCVKPPQGSSADAAPALLDFAWSSVAALAIAPLQDVLNLGKEARMNQPGSARGNWRWRVTDALLSGPSLESLRDLTRSSGRTEPVTAAS
jgi:4-alpha-glucanotransferase